MKDRDTSGLTIVGGRPGNDEGSTSSGISPGLEALLQRLAEKPRLARQLVVSPEKTLAAEGLNLTPTELAMLRDLDMQDLEQTRAMTRGGARSADLATRTQPDTGEEERQRRAAQLELVAPFVGDAGFYMGEATRGIRPQSIYPTPYAVAEALLRTSEQFRSAFLDNALSAILSWPDLPLSDEERQMLLPEPIRQRLEWVAQNV
jgi:hypothetical protein